MSACESAENVRPVTRAEELREIAEHWGKPWAEIARPLKADDPDAHWLEDVRRRANVDDAAFKAFLEEHGSDDSMQD